MPEYPQRKLVVRTYVHFEGIEAPGYYVDGEVTDMRLDPKVSKENLHRLAGMVAQGQAEDLMRRFLDENDPTYGAKGGQR